MSPLTYKGKVIMDNMMRHYDSSKKAKQVFYASRNAGKIKGVDPASMPNKKRKKGMK